jgi:hypothetical protein
MDGLFGLLTRVEKSRSKVSLVWFEGSTRRAG